jgi:hypothetical protein
MANRIAYMDRNNIPWKIFYNTNMPARKRENVKNGLFDASAWKPLPSGLSGPSNINSGKMKQVKMKKIVLFGALLSVIWMHAVGQTSKYPWVNKVGAKQFTSIRKVYKVNAVSDTAKGDH